MNRRKDSLPDGYMIYDYMDGLMRNGKDRWNGLMQELAFVDICTYHQVDVGAKHFHWTNNNILLFTINMFQVLCKKI